MPKTKQTNREREAEARLQAWEEFEAGFRRSKKGNRWRHYDGLTLTIFRRQGDGYYGWSIADNDGLRFSPGGYETEEDAMGALWDELGVW